MTNDVIAALEIGTSMIRSVVCEIRDDDSISVLALSEVKSNGIRKGEKDLEILIKWTDGQTQSFKIKELNKEIIVKKK